MQERKIALTGGIATGKTTVAKRLSELGAIILDADDFARRVVEPGTPSWSALRDLLGPRYFDSAGNLKRRELRERIIGDPGLRKRLDSLLHPFIVSSMWSEREKQRALHPGRVIIFDIPLLFEGGFDPSFDTIILVYAPPEIQVRRLMQRDGLELDEAWRTLSIQLPIETKKAASHYVINNSVDLGSTMKQTEQVWKELLDLP